MALHVGREFSALLLRALHAEPAEQFGAGLVASAIPGRAEPRRGREVVDAIARRDETQAGVALREAAQQRAQGVVLQFAVVGGRRRILQRLQPVEDRTARRSPIARASRLPFSSPLSPSTGGSPKASAPRRRTGPMRRPPVRTNSGGRTTTRKPLPRPASRARPCRPPNARRAKSCPRRRARRRSAHADAARPSPPSPRRPR